MLGPDDSRHADLSRTQTALLVAAIIAAAAVALYLMGHPLICKCGYVKLWHFDVQSAENSQHLIDWYTPSHLIHGFLFYWLLWLLSRWLPMSLRPAAGAGRRHRGVMGGGREHRLRHQPLSRDDHLARLLRRQRHQLGERHSVHGGGLLPGRAPAGLAHRDHRAGARAVHRRHDQGQSDAERADVRVAARFRAALAAGKIATERCRTPRSEIDLDAEHHAQNEPEKTATVG